MMEKVLEDSKTLGTPLLEDCSPVGMEADGWEQTQVTFHWTKVPANLIRQDIRTTIKKEDLKEGSAHSSLVEFGAEKNNMGTKKRKIWFWLPFEKVAKYHRPKKLEGWKPC